MAEIIREEWVDPVHELPFESAEGGYQGAPVLEGDELLEEIKFLPENEQLFEMLPHGSPRTRGAVETPFH